MCDTSNWLRSVAKMSNSSLFSYIRNNNYATLQYLLNPYQFAVKLNLVKE